MKKETGTQNDSPAIDENLIEKLEELLVDFTWKDGKIISYKITSAYPQKVTIKVNDEIKAITSTKH